jgi:hypothetical protein
VKHPLGRRADDGRRVEQTILTAGFLVFVVMVGCAERPHAGPSVLSIPRRAAEAHHLYSVPFYPGESDQGGPSTLASVLTYWGFHTEPPVLEEEIHMSRLGTSWQAGSLPVDLVLAAQARGLRAQSYSGTLENLKTELKAGHPLVALVAQSLSAGTRLSQNPLLVYRYVVIVGFDDRRQGLYVHSGQEPDSFVPYSRFLQSWERTERWVLLILPPAMQGRNRI